MMEMEEFYAALSKDAAWHGWHLDCAGRLRDRHECCPMEAVAGHVKEAHPARTTSGQRTLDACIEATVGEDLGGTVITAADNRTASCAMRAQGPDAPSSWALILEIRRRMLKAVGLEGA
jgi:hypothetical protein